MFTDEQDRETSAFYEIKGNGINISNVISLGWAISPTQPYEPTRSVVIHALMKAAYLMNAILLLILYISWFLFCSPFCKNPTSLMSTLHFHKQWPSLWCYSMMIWCSRFCSQGYSHCLIQSALRCLSQMKLHWLKLEPKVASTTMECSRCTHWGDSMLFSLIAEADLKKWSRTEKSHCLTAGCIYYYQRIHTNIF